MTASPTRTTIATRSAILARYGSDGSFDWVKVAPGGHGLGVATLASGDVAWSGWFNSSIAFSNGRTMNATPVDSANVYLARFDPNTRTFVWLRHRSGELRGFDVSASAAPSATRRSCGATTDRTALRPPGSSSAVAVTAKPISRRIDHGSASTGSQVPLAINAW